MTFIADLAAAMAPTTPRPRVVALSPDHWDRLQALLKECAGPTFRQARRVAAKRKQRRGW